MYIRLKVAFVIIHRSKNGKKGPILTTLVSVRFSQKLSYILTRQFIRKLLTKSTHSIYIGIMQRNSRFIPFFFRFTTSKDIKILGKKSFCSSLRKKKLPSAPFIQYWISIFPILNMSKLFSFNRVFKLSLFLSLKSQTKIWLIPKYEVL